VTERVTLITGASAGIGTELARVFASNGHRVVAKRRDRSHLLNVCDVPCDGCRGDHVSIAELCLHAARIEIAFCAVPLDRADRAGKASVCVSLGSFFNGEGILAVVGCRD
jgi:NAD(P)-dependent dehydrogenase (short-subunit alcohol dehydrogenase family)